MNICYLWYEVPLQELFENFFKFDLKKSVTASCLNLQSSCFGIFSKNHSGDIQISSKSVSPEFIEATPEGLPNRSSGGYSEGTPRGIPNTILERVQQKLLKEFKNEGMDAFQKELVPSAIHCFQIIL